LKRSSSPVLFTPMRLTLAHALLGARPAHIDGACPGSCPSSPPCQLMPCSCGSWLLASSSPPYSCGSSPAGASPEVWRKMHFCARRHPGHHLPGSFLLLLAQLRIFMTMRQAVAILKNLVVHCLEVIFYLRSTVYMGEEIIQRSKGMFSSRK
jgi:hypothetical protein